MSAERDVPAPMILTIGHSTRPLDMFMLLRQHAAERTTSRIGRHNSPVSPGEGTHVRGKEPLAQILGRHGPAMAAEPTDKPAQP